MDGSVSLFSPCFLSVRGQTQYRMLSDHRLRLRAEIDRRTGIDEVYIRFFFIRMLGECDGFLGYLERGVVIHPALLDTYVKRCFYRKREHVDVLGGL